MKIRLLTASLMTAIAALPSAAQCIGDTNEDGTVNTHDLLLALSDWGPVSYTHLTLPTTPYV